MNGAVQHDDIRIRDRRGEPIRLGQKLRVDEAFFRHVPATLLMTCGVHSAINPAYSTNPMQSSINIPDGHFAIFPVFITR